MNTVRILICATFALLIAALVYEFSNKGNSSDEKSITELENELALIRLKNQRERDRYLINSNSYTPYVPPINVPTNLINTTPAPITPPAAFVNPHAQAEPEPLVAPTQPSISAAELAKSEEENTKLKKALIQQKNENDILNSEANAIQNELQSINNPTESKRAAEIAQALVMAKVNEFDKKHLILALELIRPQNLTSGQILGIRRGTGGIIGRVKLGRLDGNVGIADVIPGSFFNSPVEVKVGDEIIVIP